jgi:hypothetical protein
MARTRSSPSQPNNASQEPQRGENPMERKEARGDRERVGAQTAATRLELRKF